MQIDAKAPWLKLRKKDVFFCKSSCCAKCMTACTARCSTSEPTRISTSERGEHSSSEEGNADFMT